MHPAISSRRVLIDKDFSLLGPKISKRHQLKLLQSITDMLNYLP